MDTRDTPEQAELRRSSGQLARELAPAPVADLDDTPEDVRREMTFHPVMSLDEVLELSLESRSAHALS